MTYEIAKRAVQLFEYEYIGQGQARLWDWAVKLATEEIDAKRCQAKS